MNDAIDLHSRKRMTEAPKTHARHDAGRPIGLFALAWTAWRALFRFFVDRKALSAALLFGFMICEIVQQESASFLSLREEFRPLLALPQSVLDAILTWVLSRETFRAYGDEAAFALSSSNSERRGALGRLFLFWLTMNATSYFATNNWINALLFLFGLGALLLQFYPVALSLEPEKANLRRAIGQARGWVLRTFLSMLIALVPVFIPVALYMLWPTGDLPESAWIELLITPALFSFILFLANMTSIVAFLHARRAWKNS